MTSAIEHTSRGLAVQDHGHAGACAEPWLDAGDLLAAARIAAGSAMLGLPEAARSWLLDRIARHRTRHPPTAQRHMLARMHAFLATATTAGDFDDFLFRWNRHHLAYELHVLEAALGLPVSWPIEVRGTERARAELARGRGVIFWAMPFLYGPAIGACGVRREGLPVIGLSRWTHGYSTTRLGAALLNPLRVRAENRFLAARLVIGRGQSPLVALRGLLRVLRSNRPVSILLAPLADCLVEVPFAGGKMRAPIGPLRLAERAGCAVMPVHTWRERERFVVELGTPLPSVEDAGGAVPVVAELARRLENRVRLVPDQFHWLHPSFLPAPPADTQRGE